MFDDFNPFEDVFGGGGFGSASAPGSGSGIGSSGTVKTTENNTQTTESTQLGVGDNTVFYGGQGSDVTLTDPGILDFARETQMMFGQNMANTLGFVEKQNQEVLNAYESTSPDATKAVIVVLGGGMVAFTLIKLFGKK